MHLTPDETSRMEGLYGTPRAEWMAFEMGDPEWETLKRSQVSGRSHDVTLFILKEDRLAVIAKHTYPPGLFRAPSGGVLPGESMEQGIAREMIEETGLEIRLDCYLLRVHVEFTHQGERILWTTHVFTGEHVSGEIAPHDREEIREARWVSLDEMAGVVRKGLLSSQSGGLRYRAFLHDRVMKALGRGF